MSSEAPAAVEPHGSVDEAQLAAQAELAELDLRRNSEGQIQSRNYKYLDYPKLLEQVRPVLSKHGLLWRTFPTTVVDEGAQKPALTYQLVHPSTKTEIGNTMLLVLGDKQTSQAQGSALSYARRYALQAVLELAPDTDDDGAAASRPPRPAPVDPDAPLSAESRAAMFEAIAERRLDRAKVLGRVGVTDEEAVSVGQGQAVKRILDGIDATRAAQAASA